jgi:hypothetical protein
MISWLEMTLLPLQPGNLLSVLASLASRIQLPTDLQVSRAYIDIFLELLQKAGS